MKYTLSICLLLISAVYIQKALSTAPYPPEYFKIKQIPNEDFCFVATRTTIENGKSIKKWENFDFDIIEFIKLETVLRGLDCGVVEES